MKIGNTLFIVSCGIGLALAGAPLAHAAEARPWLCRSKPVFSSDSAMSYQIVNHGSSRWELLLMQFEMGSAHDGYEVVNSQELPASAGRASGTLAPGRYFAVAMYKSGGGRWICPGYAEDKDRPARRGQSHLLRRRVARLRRGADCPFCRACGRTCTLNKGRQSGWRQRPVESWRRLVSQPARNRLRRQAPRRWFIVAARPPMSRKDSRTGYAFFPPRNALSNIQ